MVNHIVNHIKMVFWHGWQWSNHIQTTCGKPYSSYMVKPLSNHGLCLPWVQYGWPRLTIVTCGWIWLHMAIHDYPLLDFTKNGWPCVLTWLTMHKPWWHHVKTTCVNHVEAIVKLNVKTMVKQWYVFTLGWLWLTLIHHGYLWLNIVAYGCPNWIMDNRSPYTPY